MKNILITGINGFVGNAIAKHLKREYKIFGIGRQKEVANLTIDRYDKIDISKIDEILEYSKNQRIDIIVHCAASLNEKDHKSLYESNILGTWNIIQLARMTKAKIIYISSIPVIGVPVFLPITEEHPVNPQSNYHLSKYIGECLLHNQSDLKAITLRIPSPIGEGMPENKILPSFIRKCLNGEKITLLGEGKREQDYIDVRDITNAVELAMKSQQCGLFNIASNNHISNFKLAETCKSFLQSKSDIEFCGKDNEENIRWQISIDKATQKLGYVPKESILQSIRHIADDMI